MTISGENFPSAADFTCKVEYAGSVSADADCTINSANEVIV
jgi:hypothetical protein